MKLFNAFQITLAFAGWPFLVAYLSTASTEGHFTGAGAAFWVSVVAYLVAFGVMMICVVDKLDG